MSKSNPFNLPPPWSPRYALPQNVEDEGLERHAYTTAWAPRGSYDDPKVGYAGYAVPEYVKEEGYGRGAFVTKWAPRGSYPGPKVVHWLDKQSAKVVDRTMLPGGAAKLTIETMAGVEAKTTGGAAPVTSYGLSSARALIETVKMMPPADRVRQLKLAMGRIDPKLYSRAEEIANKEAKAGVPADVALERGIAVAMSHGIAVEIVDLGRGKKPPRRSQLGAVCYGCTMMLGEEPATRAGFCWIPQYVRASDNQTVPGHWERMRAGQTVCSSEPPPGSAVPVVRTGSSGGVTVTNTQTGEIVKTVVSVPPPTTPEDQKFLNIGPFLIPISTGSYRDHRALTDEKKAFVDQNIALAAKLGGVSIAEMKTGRYPFVRFKGPNDEPWGLFYQESDGTQKTDRGTTIPAGTIVAYHKIAPSMLGNIIGDAWGGIKDAAAWVGGAIASVFKKIWAGIKWVAAKVVDFVKDAVKWIGDKACDLFTSPVGQIAGAAAGAYLGGPAGAQAGAMGAQAAAQMCADPPAPTTPPPAAEGGPSMMPILLIGGAGIAAVLLLGKKKH